MTTKGNRHIENQENSIQEWVTDGTLTVLHVCGKTNIANICTKEMRDTANFHHLRDALMSRVTIFKRFHYSTDVSPPHATKLIHAAQYSVHQLSVHYVAPPQPGLLEVLVSHASFCLPSTISSLFASGQFLLSCIATSFSRQVFLSSSMGGVVM
jgi:hypothetical protein